MLPKKNRADKKMVARIFQEGGFINSPNLTFKFILDKGADSPHISFVAPKNIAKLSVQRNYLRRQGYTALASYINHFPPGIIGVFIFRKYQDVVSILENEIKKISDKIN